MTDQNLPVKRRSRITTERMRLLLAVAAIAFFAVSVNALSVDTVIVGNGGPGPYSLGTHYVDSSSISARYADSTRGEIPPHAYIDRVNGILFSVPVDSGLQARTRRIGRPHEAIHLQRQHAIGIVAAPGMAGIAVAV